MLTSIILVLVMVLAAGLLVSRNAPQSQPVRVQRHNDHLIRRRNRSDRI